MNPSWDIVAKVEMAAMVGTMVLMPNMKEVIKLYLKKVVLSWYLFSIILFRKKFSQVNIFINRIEDNTSEISSILSPDNFAPHPDFYDTGS